MRPRILLSVITAGLPGLLLSACVGNISPPPQPTPALIGSTVEQLAAISTDPVTAWQAGDYAVRTSCDAYLNQSAQRDSNFGLAGSTINTSGLAAAGFAAARGNPVVAALATSASVLAGQLLSDFRSAGSLPYSAETTTLIQNALDAYEVAARPPTSMAQAASLVEGAWWLCSPAGYAELASKSISSAQVSAAAVLLQATMPPTSPSRPRVLVNGR